MTQVTFKRISPEAIPAPTAPLDTGRSGKSAATQESSLSVLPDGMESEKRAATEAAHMAATAPDQPDGWAPPMAADALLMRGRLALLDGKFRVCQVEVVNIYPCTLLYRQNSTQAHIDDMKNATSPWLGWRPPWQDLPGPSSTANPYDNMRCWIEGLGTVGNFLRMTGGWYFVNTHNGIRLGHRRCFIGTKRPLFASMYHTLF